MIGWGDLLVRDSPGQNALHLLFGDGGRVWLKMQSERDLWRAEQNIDLSTIEPVRAA